VKEKQQNPVQWNRAKFRGNATPYANVARLMQLRVSDPALQRNEVEFVYFLRHDAADCQSCYGAKSKKRRARRFLIWRVLALYSCFLALLFG
jgi:hypothetical protein